MASVAAAPAGRPALAETASVLLALAFPGAVDSRTAEVVHPALAVPPASPTRLAHSAEPVAAVERVSAAEQVLVGAVAVG